MLCSCCWCAHLQELRKASGQQLREVQVVQGEAVKQLRDERQQAEKKEAQLKVRAGRSGAGVAAGAGVLTRGGAAGRQGSWAAWLRSKGVEQHCAASCSCCLARRLCSLLFEGVLTTGHAVQCVVSPLKQ